MNKYIPLSILEEKNLENCLLKEPILNEISFINESLGSFNRQIDKEINKMKIISIESIKDACRNGSLFFYKYFVKGDLKYGKI